MILLSAAGTFRLILILLIVFLVLRMIARARQAPGTSQRGFTFTRPDVRGKGEVRIERPGDERRGGGPVEDADFEEVK